MQVKVKNLTQKVYGVISSAEFRFLMLVVLVAALMIGWRTAFAGDDPLEGTDKSLVATLGSGGTGRKFIYLIEGVSAVATYIKTRNILMFSGVVAIAIFLNILFTVAGIN